MPHPLPPAFAVSRPAWWRLLEPSLEAAQERMAAAGHWWAQRRAARRQAAVRGALQHLSAHMLRDIGAPDDLVADAMRRDTTAHFQRSVALRGE
jgi:hypothetical protein